MAEKPYTVVNFDHNDLVRIVERVAERYGPEIERLRRIEAAAKKVWEIWDGEILFGQRPFANALYALDRALRGEEEPKP